MRKVINLNQGWSYLDHYNERFIAGVFTDYTWETINLPHPNRELPYNYFDERDYQFISTYRKDLYVDSKYSSKRIFLDFDGVMTAATVYLNGKQVGSHKGGYTPFSCDISQVVKFGEQNQLLVIVDSTERDDIPPFGNVIDYLCYGGIYRDVNLRIVDSVFIANIFAKPHNVLSDDRKLEVDVHLDSIVGNLTDAKLEISLTDANQVVASQTKTLEIKEGESVATLSLGHLSEIRLWDIDNPNLYNLSVSLVADEFSDRYETRIGFRDAVVKEDGFYLNGKKLKIRGLNRHQAWPYVGYAMPKRVQERDADILKYELNLNTVRTSHYPQSKYFLDRCDEIGLLVIEEIPGWQHIGDEAWKQVACNNVREMITRDWNHPAIFLWGVRINESADDHDFYTETNRIARELDPTRQTCGVRVRRHSEFLEDVFTMNDFAHSGGELVLRDQKEVTGLDYNVPYMVTEYNGHMYPTKRFDHEERLMEHAMRHLRVINAAGLDPHISGTVGWCAFDYNTHYQFGSGDRICYHGVMDMFRIPKFAAYAYGSQVDPKQDVVLMPVTLWARGERSIGGVFPLVIFTNCDYVELKVGGEFIERYYPDGQQFAGVEYPPILITKTPPVFGEWGCHWEDGEFIAYLDDQPVASHKFVKDPVPAQLEIKADDYHLNADGSDATRIEFKLVDQVGNLLPYINDFITIELEGPGEIIGPKQVALIGGCIATWVKTTLTPGTIRVKASSTRLTSDLVEIKVEPTR